MRYRGSDARLLGEVGHLAFKAARCDLPYVKIYESLGVHEYWIIDVQNVHVIAFEIENRGSRRIDQSQVLPGLNIAVLEQAFRRSRQMNHGKVSA